MQVSKADLRNKLYQPAVADVKSSVENIKQSDKTTTATADHETRYPKRVSAIVDSNSNKCPSIAEHRGQSSVPLPHQSKNVASDRSQLSLPFSESTQQNFFFSQNGQPARHSIQKTDVTEHASKAIAVGHGNIFGKGASVTTKGWTKGKFV
eukprot:GDKK01012901.1.p1 GENE.GDKK01012901.1~~GDKK01012901.1.p1  ORF type:complete len:151 (-),score=20.01 GDKK01012901.1:37-489(-)